MIYLDYSAHTPVDERILEYFCGVERGCAGNANARHAAGRYSDAILSEAVGEIADLTRALPEEVIPLSGASEANNLAIKGIARMQRHYGRHVISTPLEHSSVSGPLAFLQEQGWEVELVRMGRDGRVDLELLREDTILVTVCAVDSELGTVQPIAGIKEMLKKSPQCLLHVDATQAMGKIPFTFENADTMSFSAHKFYGLLGSGVLLRRKDLVLEPLIHGGSSTTPYRSGTPAVALTASTARALRFACERLDDSWRTVKERNGQLRAELARRGGVVINSPDDAIPHILNLSVEGIRGAVFRDALDRRGVCVSVKSACSVENTPSRAVMAISGNRSRALNAWRISLSHLTLESEIQDFLVAFDEAREELSGQGEAHV